MSRKFNLNPIAPLLIVALLSGCAALGPEQTMFGGGRVNTAAANQVFDKAFESFNEEQLLRLLDPKDDAKLGEREYQPLGESQKNALLRKAFWAANSYDNAQAHRSQIQDRLIGASNQRCNVFTTYLKRISTYNNGIFGTLTTVLGGAGSIVTGENAARLLSGLAGISSGTRAELNQAIFESVATSIIVPSIHQNRATILQAIIAKRDKPIKDYTIEGAIADAIMYHGACSMDAGIGHAQKSIQSYEDIGINRFTAMQTQLGIARSASESFTLGPIASPIVSEKLLNEFALKISDYKAKKLDLSKFGDLESSVKDGALRKNAKELDDKLKELLFSYASTTGSDKLDAFRRIDAQQRDAKDFANLIDRKNSDLLDALKNATK